MREGEVLRCCGSSFQVLAARYEKKRPLLLFFVKQGYVCSCLELRSNVSGGLVEVQAVVEVNWTGVVESFVGVGE